MNPLFVFCCIYAVVATPLCIWAWWDDIWSCHGLFWYHEEDELGHMLCYLGVRKTLVLFKKYWSWVERS